MFVWNGWRMPVISLSSKVVLIFARGEVDFALDWFEKEFVCARWIRDGFAFDEFDMDIGGIAHRLDSNHCVLVQQTSFVIPRKDIQLEAALMPQSKEHSWWNRNHRSLILLTNWVIHFLNEKRFGSIECKSISARVFFGRRRQRDQWVQMLLNPRVPR